MKAMKGDEMLKHLDTLGWSKTALAFRLQEHPTTVKRWAADEQAIPDPVAGWLRAVTSSFKAVRMPHPREWRGTR